MNGETIAMIKALQVKSIEELKTSGGSADAGKVLTVGSDGKLIPAELEVGEGQVAVDGSLSVSGAAADAKKVGDALSAVNGSLDVKEADLRNALNYISGNLVQDATEMNAYISDGDHKIRYTGNAYTICVEGKPNASYVIKKSTPTIMRAGCYSDANPPSATLLANYVTNYSASSDPLYVETDATNKYIFVQLYTDNDSAEYKSISANIGSLVIHERDYTDVKIENISNNLNKVTEYVGEPTVYNSWNQGNYGVYHTFGNRTDRCGIKPDFTLHHGEILRITPNNDRVSIIAWTVDSTTGKYTNILNSSWRYNELEYTAESDVQISVAVARQENTDIVPADVNAVVKVYKNDDNLTNKIDDLSATNTSLDLLNNRIFGDGLSAIFEFGWFTANVGSAWTYTDGNTMVRTPSNYKLFLPKGSVVKLTDYTDARFYVAEKTKNGIGITQPGWQTRDYIIPNDGYYGIMISNLTPIAQSDITALSSLLVINFNSIYERLDEIESIIGYEQVPPYYDSQLETKIAEIADNINSVGRNGETFIFITDLHWETNYKHSPALIRYILNNSNVKIVLCGGDLINTAEKDVAIETMRNCIKAYSYTDYEFKVAFGNHDANSLNWSTTEERDENMFSPNTVFGLTQKPYSYSNHYFSDNAINFYFDRIDSKTRFVFVDSGQYGEFDAETIPNICALLNETPADYHIVIIQHWIVSETSASNITIKPDSIKLCNIIHAFNAKTSVVVDSVTYDFSNTNGEIVLYLGGHTHFDASYDSDSADNPAKIPIVLTNTDSTRENTITVPTDQQCFDVITIDYTNRTINFVRIGRGSDRSFTY